jgi:ADP-ribosylglycohydrolase
VTSATAQTTPPLSRDRFRGCLLGLAVGDAVGTTLEFRPPGSFEPIADMVGGGPFGLAPGQWTDDTSMALCLAESLLACKGFDPVHQLETAGNGSIMRLAPVPMRYAADPAQAISYAALSSRTTHGAAECVDACRYLAGLIVGALHGRTKDELLAPLFSPVAGLWEREPLAPKVAAVAAGSFKQKNPRAIRGTGYVIDSLEAALWAFHRADSFREAVLLAVNLGDDADTTGAVVGHIAGAFYGEVGIPAEWLAKLAMRETVEGFAARLAEWATG